MRVLLVYPELPLSFWSFHIITRRQGYKALMPPLGLITVAALLPPDWELKLVDENVEPLTDHHWQWAGLVMVSGMHLQRKGLLAVIAESKRRGIPCVAGGPCTASDDGALLRAGCTLVVKGEAETTIGPLLDAIAANRTGEVIETDEWADMEASPVPRFDLLRIDAYSNLNVQTSRGCPFQCEFCDVIKLFGRRPRYKSARQLVDELEAARRLNPNTPSVFICDDNFIGDKRRARELLKVLIPWNESAGKPFSYYTQASIDLGRDLGLIDLMTEANFCQVFIGLESPDEEALTIACKHQNTRDPLLRSIRTIQSNGLSVIGSFIMGFDGERKGVGGRIVQLVEASGMPVVMVNVLQAPPETGLWNRLEREGRLLEVEVSGDSTLVTMNFLPSRPAGEILAEYAHVWSEIYDPARFLRRAYRWILGTRPTRAAIARAGGKGVAPAPKPCFKLSKMDVGDARVFLAMAWHHGVLAEYRALFWRQLFGIWLKNRSRIHRYLALCAIADDMFDIRDRINGNLSPVAVETRASGESQPERASP